ncbi:hypothetical protein GCM10009765_82000 [Fodinicola feengrottensis]|uniref:Uncharacterized protein n=1 Tax=Fodinicola feengrottensis TaxID=435914 RepID=A0ABP4VB92_9ACTN
MDESALAAYHTLLSSDVVLRTSRDDVHLPESMSKLDAAITFLPMPATEIGVVPDWISSAREVLVEVVGGHRRAPTVGGTRLLNVFTRIQVPPGAQTHYVDPAGSGLVELPDDGLPRFPGGAEGMVVVTSYPIASAKAVAGDRMGIVAWQDTAVLLSRLEAALHEQGLTLKQRTYEVPDRALFDELSLDSGRDEITCVADIVSTKEAVSSPPFRREKDLDFLAELHDVADTTGVYVRAYPGADIPAGVYRVDASGLVATALDPTGLDDALELRDIRCRYLIVFTSDLLEVLAAEGERGLPETIMRQTAAADAACQRYQGHAELCLCLPTTLLAPDERGWATAFRSFAALCLEGPQISVATVVRW